MDLPRGHVKEVCKEWMQREDGALAQRLQSQEINEFYQNNKVRNAIVREDFPRALDEQRREIEVAKEVEAKYREYLENQEKADRLLAEKLEHKLKIEKLRKEEIESKTAKEMALELQKREEEAERQRLLTMQTEVEKAEKLAKKLQMYDEECNLSQAERDRLIAIRAQNEELAEKDRQLAIEAQDEELARLLQEREKKRAKRIKEKYRLKRQQQQQLVQQSNQNSENVDLSDNYPQIDETYSDPIDLIPQQEKSIPYPIPRQNENSKSRLHDNYFHDTNDDESNDETYALPIDIKKKQELNLLREKKPKLPKPNSIHEIPNHTSTINSEFVQTKDYTAGQMTQSLTKSAQFPNSNLSYPTTPSVCHNGDEVQPFENSYNRKLKKDKKDKCTHQ